MRSIPGSEVPIDSILPQLRVDTRDARKDQSKAGVDDIDDVLAGPCRPVAASLCHDGRQLDFVGDTAFDEVQVHAFGGVPCDVAVERPDTRTMIMLVFESHHL